MTAVDEVVLGGDRKVPGLDQVAARHAVGAEDAENVLKERAALLDVGVESTNWNITASVLTAGTSAKIEKKYADQMRLAGAFLKLIRQRHIALSVCQAAMFDRPPRCGRSASATRRRRRVAYDPVRKETPGRERCARVTRIRRSRAQRGAVRLRFVMLEFTEVERRAAAP